MKKISVFMLMFVLISLVGCTYDDSTSHYEPLKTDETKATTTQIVTTLQTESNFSESTNPLTGNISSSNLTNTRPISVMINNHNKSLPQYGIEDADILFEIPVEGGITRLMGIYQDAQSVPRVCSIRSSRYYFAEIAQGFDSIYMHWGLDLTLAKKTLSENNIDHFDGGDVGAPVFGRDSNRLKTYSKEHTGYLEGKNIPEILKQYNKRTDIKEDYKNKEFFNFTDNAVMTNSSECSQVTLSFSKDYYSDLIFDTGIGKYKKYHSGKPQIDSSTNNQLSYENVLVLNTSITQPYVNTGLLNVDLSGGNGWYISNGQKIKLKWTKGNINNNIKLFNEDGSELQLYKGKTYIGIIGYDKPVTLI